MAKSKKTPKVLHDGNQVDAVHEFVAWVKDRLLIDPNYEVFVAVGPPDDEEAWASVNPVQGRWVTPLWIAKAFWKQDDETQARVLVHEILHLTHSAVADAVTLGMWPAVEGTKVESAYRVACEIHRLELEKMVDRASYAWMRALPALEVWTSIKAKHEVK